MFRLMFGGKKETFRPVKNHQPGSKREQYSNFTLKTLGSGDIRGAVKLPPGEELNEWIAANTVDFFNELSLIWGIITDIGLEPLQAGSGFPPGFEYRWTGGSRFKNPPPCSGPQYVEHVMTWVDAEINKDSLFPTSSATPFPKNFMQAVKVIYTRLFRIYAIVYSHHFLKLEELGAVSHLNTSFKHFVFFMWEFELVHPTEQEALKDIIEELRVRHGASFPGQSRPGSVKITADHAT